MLHKHRQPAFVSTIATLLLLAVFAIGGYLAYSMFAFSPYGTLYTMSSAFLAGETETLKRHINEEAIVENLYEAVRAQDVILTKEELTKKLLLNAPSKPVMKRILREKLNTAITDCVETRACLPQLNDPNGKNILTLHPIVLWLVFVGWLQPEGGPFAQGESKTFNAQYGEDRFVITFSRVDGKADDWEMTGLLFPGFTLELADKPLS